MNLGPLERRLTQSSWATLLDLALPALDHVFAPDQAQKGPTAAWTLGGGTALALRLAHRVSDDIDIFVAGAPLRLFTPFNNPAAARIGAKPDWPGHYLKYHCAGGEIDFLSASLQTEPGFSRETFRGRVIALETAQEVIVKKIRYRAAQLTPRDAFDIACVAAVDSGLPGIIARETGDALPRLEQGLNLLAGRSIEAFQTQIRATEAFRDILPNAVARARRVLEMARLAGHSFL
jgi:Nucleotidyl transferase AbiEii toxin, Type IV TA system